MKLFTTLAVCLLAVSSFAADPPKNPMKPGKWEITTQMDMPGMQMPARSFTKCVTKEDAENVENAVPRGRQDSQCKISDVKVEGNTISWKMNCAESQMTGEGKATYEGDTYVGEMHVKAADHEMTIKYTGKRLGDCDAAK
jgi:hypothetical protein